MKQHFEIIITDTSSPFKDIIRVATENAYVTTVEHTIKRKMGLFKTQKDTILFHLRTMDDQPTTLHAAALPSNIILAVGIFFIEENGLSSQDKLEKFLNPGDELKRLFEVKLRVGGVDTFQEIGKLLETWEEERNELLVNFQTQLTAEQTKHNERMKDQREKYESLLRQRDEEMANFQKDQIEAQQTNMKEMIKRILTINAETVKDLYGMDEEFT